MVIDLCILHLLTQFKELYTSYIFLASLLFCHSNNKHLLFPFICYVLAPFPSLTIFTTSWKQISEIPLLKDRRTALRSSVACLIKS